MVSLFYFYYDIDYKDGYGFSKLVDVAG